MSYKPVFGRSQTLDNVRFDTGSQDQNSVQLIKTHSKVFEGPEVVNFEVAFSR